MIVGRRSSGYAVPRGANGARRHTDPARRLFVVAALVLVVGACSSAEPRVLPPPSSTSSTVPESTTTTVDLSLIPLETIPGRTTTTLEQFGDSILAGVVGGPEGAVAGATVRIERLVGGATQVLEVGSAEDGTWKVEGLPGGRFRIRAHLPPTLGIVEPQTLFLNNGETAELTLILRRFEGIDVRSGTTPGAPLIGDAVNLAVRITRQSVRDDGVVVFEPTSNVPVRVESTGWRELEDPVDITDGDGRVVFSFSCDRVGPVTATAIVGVERLTVPLSVPSCAPLPTTTTTTTAPPSTTTPASTSTTAG